MRQMTVCVTGCDDSQFERRFGARRRNVSDSWRFPCFFHEIGTPAAGGGGTPPTTKNDIKAI